MGNNEPTESVRELPLSQGYVAIVDVEDYDLVSQVKWCAIKGRTRLDGTYVVYAARSFKYPTGAKSTQHLHRIILNAPSGMVVDHINGDGLDNRRSNLRLCTNAENLRNRIKYATGTSKFRGVSWCPVHKKWRVRIKSLPHVGYFDIEDEAAHAYDTVIAAHYGEFARFNFVKEGGI